jgi:CRP-like cAMP-binding protein
MGEARGVEHLWALLDSRQRAVLEGAGVRAEHPAGATLLREGAPGGSALVLLAGRVKVVAAEVGVLAVRVPGDVVGELAVLDGRPRSASVISVDPVRVLRVGAAEFNAILDAHPGIAEALLRVIASRLRVADRCRVELAGTAVSQRLAGLAADQGALRPDDVAITLPYSEEDLVRMVPGPREAVLHALEALRSAGVITTGPHSTTIHQPEILGHLATNDN